MDFDTVDDLCEMMCLEEYNKVVQICLKFIKRNPKDSDAVRFLCNAYCSQKRFDDALLWASKFYEYDPEDPYAIERVIHCLDEMKANRKNFAWKPGLVWVDLAQAKLELTTHLLERKNRRISELNAYFWGSEYEHLECSREDFIQNLKSDPHFQLIEDDYVQKFIRLSPDGWKAGKARLPTLQVPPTLLPPPRFPQKSLKTRQNVKSRETR